MPLMDMIKDPETGKIKPAVLIGGAGIGIAGVFLLMSKGSAAPNSGVTSPGQSGDNTDALNALQAAIQQLAAGGIGGGIGIGTGSGSTISNPGGSSRVIAAKVGTLSGPGTTINRNGTATVFVKGVATNVPINPAKLGSFVGGVPTTTAIPRTAAVSKPSNSGLSPAPVVTR